MSLNCEIKITASLKLDEHWLDDDAIEGLSLGEIKELGLELIKEDMVEFFEKAKWSASVEYRPARVKKKEEPK